MKALISARPPTQSYKTAGGKTYNATPVSVTDPREIHAAQACGFLVVEIVETEGKRVRRPPPEPKADKTEKAEKKTTTPKPAASPKPSATGNKPASGKGRTSTPDSDD